MLRLYTELKLFMKFSHSQQPLKLDSFGMLL